MNKKEFAEAVLTLDQHTCRSFYCTGLYVTDPPHHIKFRSQGGDNKVTNGITLCRQCHDFAHGKGNLKINDKRVTARQFMIMVLNHLVCEKFYRWHDVHEELKRKEGV